MKRSERIERDREIVTFLATPIKDAAGKDLLNPKGEKVYPTQREAGERYGLDKYAIHRIKIRFQELYDQIRAQNTPN